LKRRVCPLCGMNLSQNWVFRKHENPILARITESNGYKKIVNQNLTMGMIRDSRWYTEIKSFIGYLANRFGLVEIKQVVKEIIPDFVAHRITELEQQLKGLLKHIYVIEDENIKMKYNLKKIANEKIVSWGAVVNRLGSPKNVYPEEDIKWAAK
jgi:hypothetical protein